jgi:hypothetical protein
MRMQITDRRPFPLRSRPCSGIKPGGASSFDEVLAAAERPDAPSAARGRAPQGGWTVPASTPAQILHDPSRAKAFLADYLQREARWYAIARNPATGLTRDGWGIDPASGLPTTPRRHSAASKESLDIGICVKALGGSPEAAALLANGDVAAAREAATKILAKKMDTLEQWVRDYPGYGGFLPWFYNDDDGIKPTPDWDGHCPGLDNGEFAWAMIVAERGLRQAGKTELADRYARYNELLRTNAVRMFYDPDAGRVNGDVRISDPRSPDATYKSLGHMTGEHGVHEGQMLVLYVTLLGRDLPADASRRIWDDIRMKRIEHRDGTTWQAFWGSAHESWAYLFLPYRDMPQFRDLFRIREEIRTQNAAERGYPGLGASTNAPDLRSYISDSGIEGIGTQKVTRNDVFAVYGAFPLLLQFAGQMQGNYGLAWLANMLGDAHMYGPIGGLESGTNDGRQSAMVKTVDGSLPNLLAIMGGLEHETADAMRDLGVYDRFREIMLGEYRETFGKRPLNEPKGFALPPHPVGGGPAGGIGAPHP